MFFLAPALVLFAACSGGEVDEVQRFTDCDPLDTALCALPFPSSFFLEEADTVTGVQVSYGESSLPMNIDGVQIRPDYWNERDGFSTVAALLAYFEGVSLDGVMGHDALAKLDDPEVKTIIVDAETGERMPHFVELDRTTEEPGESLLSLQPMVPLNHDTTYVVGIRGLVDVAGEPVEVSAAFLELRDAQNPAGWDFEGRREHFEDRVFPVLEAEGFAREDLQLAWDFHTISRQDSLGRVEWMRDDALARAGASGPSYTLDPEKMVEGDCGAGDFIGLTVEGTFTSPLYTLEDKAGTFLTRDSEGMPFYNGDTQVPFLVQIPCSLIEEPRAGRIVQYGHGLLGNRYEAQTRHLRELADDAGWVLLAVNWVGMSDKDRDQISLMVAIDMSEFAFVPERSMQGFVQAALALRLAMGDLADDPLLTVDGVGLLDPERVAFYGISQGGVLGGGYAAMSTDLERVALGVAGAPYDLLLHRSEDFDPFFAMFKIKFDDHRQIRLLIALLQHLWDPGEAGGWLRSMNQLPGEGVSAKTVLLQNALGDAEVTTLGGQLMARAYGASTIGPQTREVFGVEELQAPFEGSALVEWRYVDGAEEPRENLPPDGDYSTHDCPRREPAARAQLIDFLETGVVYQYCVDDQGEPAICEGTRQGFCD